MEFKPYQYELIRSSASIILLKMNVVVSTVLTVEEFIKTFGIDDTKYISVITNEICIGGNHTHKLIFVSVFKKDDFPDLELALNNIKNKEKEQNEET